MRDLHELLGILRLTVHNDLVVHVGTRGAASAPEKAHLRTRLDPLAHRDGVTMQVAAEVSNFVAVLDLDDLGVSTPIAGISHDPWPPWHRTGDIEAAAGSRPVWYASVPFLP